MWLSKTLLAFLLLILTPALSFAATPTISGHTGMVAQGQAVTIDGANLINEDNTNWWSLFRSGTAYGFEGSTPLADGYEYQDHIPSVYDTATKLLGNKSLKLHVEGSSVWPQVLANAVMIYHEQTEYYVRLYSRWNVANGIWPDNFTKLLYEMGGSYYFQPSMNGGETPDQWLSKYGPTGEWHDNASGDILTTRWYCVEAHWKFTSPQHFTVWVDGNVVIDKDVPATDTPWVIITGVANAANTPSGFSMDNWLDGYAVSSARIYPSAIVEIGDGPTYATATKRYQYPQYLSDGTVQFEVDLTGLGAGPYYLWITNNRQERSAAYDLSGGGGDTAAPTVTAADTIKNIGVDSYTATGSASDNTGVSGCKWRLGSAPDASNGAACTGTTSFSCSTSGYSSGSNTLYVGCTDGTNWGSDSITVNYTPVTPGGIFRAIGAALIGARMQ